MRPTLVLLAMLSAFGVGLAPSLAGDAIDPHCARLGAGYVYAQDLNTCIKVSGSVQVDFGHTSRLFAHGHDGGGTSAEMGIDAQTQTEFGPVRTVIVPRVDVR